MDFSTAVRTAREARGLSQEEAGKLIAQKYGIHFSGSYLSLIETGARNNPSADVIRALIDFFGLPLGSVLDLLRLSRPLDTAWFDNLPPRVQAFVSERSALPWLKLAQKYHEKGTPVERVERLLELFAKEAERLSDASFDTERRKLSDNVEERT